MTARTLRLRLLADPDLRGEVGQTAYARAMGFYDRVALSRAIR
jgi:hypothetical protein